MPVPLSATVTVELEALEVTVIAPVAFVAEDGANIVVKVTLAPGLSTNGKFSPLTLKPVPVTVACEIVTLAAPVLVSESVRVEL